MDKLELAKIFSVAIEREIEAHEQDYKIAETTDAPSLSIDMKPADAIALAMKKENIAGAILAGGNNTRMGGRNKAFLKMNNTPIVQDAIGVFKKVFDEILLVTNSPGEYRSFRKDCLIIEDVIKNVGPLGGIHSALSYTTKGAVFFVACDMPYLHNEMIVSQIDQFNKVNCDALVPRIGQMIEPLHAVYKKNLRDKITMFIQGGESYSIKNFLQTENMHYWDLEETPFHRTVFKNLNTLNDVRDARRSS